MEDIGIDEVLLRSVAQQVQTPPARPALKAETAQLPAWRMPGFCGQSKIMTSFGALPIMALRRNDAVKTHGGRFLKVTWVDKIMFDHEFLEAHPEAQPVRVPAGAIGPRMPDQDMTISPAQALHTEAHHGRPTFRTASDIIGKRGISRRPEACVTYYLFGCGEPSTVCVDGLWCHIPKGDGIHDL